MATNERVWVARLRRAASVWLANDRVCLWLFLAGVYIAVSTLTRLVLAGRAMADGEAAPLDVPALMSVGLAYDLVTALYLFAPFALYLALLSERVFSSRWHRWFMAGASCAVIFGAIYLAAVEYFFFDEFNARFNFIAVEYLIYPHEVFVNIWQSYPVAKVLLATALLSGMIAWRARPILLSRRRGAVLPPRSRWAAVLVLALSLGGAHAALDLNSGRYSDNRVVNELAANGAYSFASAAAHSELDYTSYYLSLPQAEAGARLRGLLQTRDSTFLARTEHIERRIAADGPLQYLNVVVLLEESLGAEFVGAYGDTRGLTPVLDALAGKSMLFTRAYATGTRTVRGMEAVTASFPPVPAESIVKRARNENMFNWSTVMAKHGYSCTFIYGGFGTFDNMNYFFGSNGYRVIDRTDMEDVQFANIWGVSDEDLFRHAVSVYDEQHRRGERIFSVVMSTSNHKPFTFPAGVPGVPVKGGGREAGVRYADYAIGRFFDMARTKAWFDNTLFVIVADHGARVYGREDIPVSTYEIPLLLYAPKHIKASRVTTLTSQIDIAPTVIGILNFDYESTFFGIDVLANNPAKRLIPLNHNRDIALFDGRNLVEIGFRKTASQHVYDPVTHRQRKVPVDEERAKDVIATFQEAYELYDQRRYRVADQP